MRRALLIWVLCAAVALVGIAGTHEHVHVHDDAVTQNAHSHDHVSNAFTALSADHAASHDTEGGVDHDPTAQSVAKVASVKLFIAIAFLVAIFGLFGVVAMAFVRRWIRFVRPRSRGIYYLLPPSHAPPVAA